MSVHTSEKYPLESLSLFSGKSGGLKFLILVVGKKMAVSLDFGPNDSWRNRFVHTPYFYEPLNLSEYTNLEKVW